MENTTTFGTETHKEPPFILIRITRADMIQPDILFNILDSYKWHEVWQDITENYDDNEVVEQLLKAVKIIQIRPMIDNGTDIDYACETFRLSEVCDIISCSDVRVTKIHDKNLVDLKTNKVIPPPKSGDVLICLEKFGASDDRFKTTSAQYSSMVIKCRGGYSE